MHEGRPVDRGADKIAPADHHRAVRVAGVLGELRRCGGAQFARQPPGQAHPFALDHRAGLAPAVQRGGVLDEIDADLFQHGFGIGLDDLQRFFAEDVEVGDLALDVLRGFDADRAAFGAPRRTAATASPPPAG